MNDDTRGKNDCIRFALVWQYMVSRQMFMGCGFSFRIMRIRGTIHSITFLCSGWPPLYAWYHMYMSVRYMFDIRILSAVALSVAHTLWTASGKLSIHSNTVFCVLVCYMCMRSTTHICLCAECWTFVSFPQWPYLLLKHSGPRPGSSVSASIRVK